MRIRHHSKGKFYLIECPDGTKVVRRMRRVSHDHLVVPFEGQEIKIPADPDELLPMLAESGLCGLSLIGEPVPDVNLAGVICPKCSEDDVNWLQLMDSLETVHCDHCGMDFAVPVLTTPVVPIPHRSDGQR
jgi:hypothetical protein